MDWRTMEILENDDHIKIFQAKLVISKNISKVTKPGRVQDE